MGAENAEMLFRSRVALLGTSVLLQAFPLASPARAGEGEHEPNPGGHTLFDPTPRNQMRDFDADRPGVTDSAHTVDAGHFRLELGLFSYGRTNATSIDAATGNPTDVHDTSDAFGSVELAAGLTEAAELQLTFDGYDRQSSSSSSSAGTASGFGNTGIRLKWNILGNDGGPIAIALLPYVRFPSGSGAISSGKLEGGLSLPFTLELPVEWSLSLMPGWIRKLDPSGDGYESDFFAGAVASHDLFAGFGGFGQVAVTSSSAADSDVAVGAGFGITYKLTPDMQLDAGAVFGITNAADSVDFSTGFVFRR